MKIQYIKPTMEVLRWVSGNLMENFSIDNTGNEGADGEKKTAIEGDLDEGDEVGAKGMTDWGDWE